ncbi:uncharacterized protein RHO25_010481 [Cercospora beticola]|uniref:Uncharacterized protein n=1 Tax=Cercospora beticola TaxID=122368 RepID=A0ABZ0P1U2_CERBT|nr:hypothetical protein RHO25_010481 [Cercospora beticola]
MLAPSYGSSQLPGLGIPIEEAADIDHQTPRSANAKRVAQAVAADEKTIFACAYMTLNVATSRSESFRAAPAKVVRTEPSRDALRDRILLYQSCAVLECIQSYGANRNGNAVYDKVRNGASRVFDRRDRLGAVTWYKDEGSTTFEPLPAKAYPVA